MNSKNYNSFWAFIFSLIPGAGQMYLGLMKRGLQLMLLFTIPVVLTSLLYSMDGVLILLDFIIWFYSFFDCHHLRKAVNQGEDIQDNVIWDINIKVINHRYVGIGLIVLGGLAILNNGLYRLSNYFYNNFSENIYQAFRFIRQSTFPVLLIIIGLFLLKKSKTEKEA